MLRRTILAATPLLIPKVSYAAGLLMKPTAPPTGPVFVSNLGWNGDPGNDTFHTVSRSLNTTGANLIYIAYNSNLGRGLTLTDSAGNTWGTPITASSNGSYTLYTNYVQGSGIHTSTTHTFTTTATGSAIFSDMVILAASGSTGISPSFNSAATGAATTSMQPGSTTLSGSGMFVVSENPSGNDNTGLAIGSGFTIAIAAPTAFTIMLAYFKTSSGVSENPTITWTNSQNNTASQIAFPGSF